METDPAGFSALPDTAGITTVDGAESTLASLLAVLDFEQPGFSMNQR